MGNSKFVHVFSALITKKRQKLYCQQQPKKNSFYPSIHLLIQVLKKSLPGLLSL